MSKKIEINPGDRYGHLTVIKEVEKNKHGLRQMLCKCDCGNEKIITVSHLSGGASVSCGCHTFTKPRTDVESLIGHRFGKLVVIEYVGKQNKGTKENRISVKCKCDCGNETIVTVKNLKNGNTQGCGCTRGLACITHGCTSKHTDDPNGKRLFKIYRGILDRCNNPNNPNFKNYGGRGIKCCKEWTDSFISFKEWALENGYSGNLSIDRINVNGGYCPENCRWATQKEQCNNKRDNIIISFQGESHTAQEWGEIVGIKPCTIRYRIHQGYTPEQVLTIKDIRNLSVPRTELFKACNE